MSSGTSEAATGPAGGVEAEIAGETPVLNPFAPGFFDDPYSHYAALRKAGDVHHTTLGVMVHRYEHCFAVLRAPGTSVDERNATSPFLAEVRRGREPRGQSSILNSDPPDHTRLRRLVSQAFTVRRVERLRQRVRELVDGLLDDVARAGAGGEAVDLISLFAFPLPFQVITEMLGMPDGDRDQLRTWSHTMTRSLEPLSSPEDLDESLAAADLMEEHLHQAIAWKRRNPADDLLTALLAAEEDGDRLSTEEMIDQVRLLYIAGHETTVNLIGNGTLALLRHRDQLERLAADPSLDASAVDELLRYDSPVQLSRRIPLSELQVGGVTVPPGSLVLTLLGAANRDPAKWGPTADDLDLARPGAAGHLSFGSGIHHCLGAALARLEGAEAIGALVRRFPDLDLAGEGPVRNGRMVLRGLDRLQVRLGV